MSDQDKASHPAQRSGFGRGWVPLSRDVGIPGEGDAAWLLAQLEQEGAEPLHRPAGGPPPRSGEVYPSPAASGDDWFLRSDSWTPERKVRFLSHLAEKGNVRRACLLTGMSHASAYKLRRRDVDFARGWAAAQVLAREVAVDTLADRAIDGVEEPVWYHGEQIATRRRYDARLLLAHLGRLDKAVADDHAAAADARQFDRVLAQVAGIDPGPDLGSRADFAARCAADAAAEFDAAEGLPAADDGELDEDQLIAAEEEWYAARDRAEAEAQAEGEAEWDAVQAPLLAALDALTGGALAGEGAGEEAGSGAAGDLPEGLEFKSLGQCQPCQPQEQPAPQSPLRLDPAARAGMIASITQERDAHAGYDRAVCRPAGADRLCRSGRNQAPGGQGAQRRGGAAAGAGRVARAGGDLDSGHWRAGRGRGAGAVEPSGRQAGALGQGGPGRAGGRALSAALGAGLNRGALAELGRAQPAPFPRAPGWCRPRA